MRRWPALVIRASSQGTVFAIWRARCWVSLVGIPKRWSASYLTRSLASQVCTTRLSTFRSGGRSCRRGRITSTSSESVPGSFHSKNSLRSYGQKSHAGFPAWLLSSSLCHRSYFLARAFFAGAFFVAFATFAGAAFAPRMSRLSAVTPRFFRASTNQSGRLPRPDHVCAAFSGLRYLGATTDLVPVEPLLPRRG